MMSLQETKEYATGLLGPLLRRLRHVAAIATRAADLANTILRIGTTAMFLLQHRGSTILSTCQSLLRPAFIILMVLMECPEIKEGQISRKILLGVENSFLKHKIHQPSTLLNILGRYHNVRDKNRSSHQLSARFVLGVQDVTLAT